MNTTFSYFNQGTVKQSSRHERLPQLHYCAGSHHDLAVSKSCYIQCSESEVEAVSTRTHTSARGTKDKNYTSCLFERVSIRTTLLESYTRRIPDPDSNNPQWSCKEVQITLRQMKEGVKFKQMSFDLYRTTRFKLKLVYHLTAIDLAQHSPTTLGTTTMATTSDTTSTNSGSNTEPLRCSGPATVGIIVALSLVIVFLIGVLVLVLLCVCCRKAGGET
ncbi:uncharacterized protein LOC135345710 isoform X1 [Halichondria panicea]|uniref:uncharacterized protein LOC135345710 isoform X1 n=1 Tax=Halichondria panicea TaxID=6063 RepID=UPI00312BB383